MSRTFSNAFLDTYSYVSGERRRREHERRDERDRERAHARQQESDDMRRQSHDMEMRLRSIQIESLERERARQKSDDDRAKGLYRLAKERAILEGLQGDIDDDGIAQDLSIYLDVLNEHERDKIDPMGDGRYVSDIHQMPDGRITFEVSGGKVEGRKPITRNRGTAADGDNQVTAVSMPDLIHDHLGRMQAFEEKYGDAKAILDDPESVKRFLREAEIRNRIAMIEYSGKDPRGESPEVALAKLKAKLDEKSATTKHSRALAMEDRKHANALELEREKQKGGKNTTPTSSVQELQWMQENLGVSAEEAWQMRQDAKANPRAFIEKYVLTRMKDQQSARKDAVKSPSELVEEAQSLLQTISGGESRALQEPQQPSAMSSPSTPPEAAEQTRESLPPAAEYAGRRIRSRVTGEVLVSDGEQWVPAE